MSKDYKDTLNLPKTIFPMKANLVQREPQILEKWEKEKLYEKILKARENAPVFSFHDGPPYANGHIHLGHALNKILKDILVRSRLFFGKKVYFKPGWDCHGLPIELAVEKEHGKKVYELNIHEFRKLCREYAEKYINIQREEFKRLGLLGDWDNPYKTMDYSYEADIARCFVKCFEKGYVYKGLKPVQWCIHCQTALAEAEVEYEDHASPSIYVAFPFLTEEENKWPEVLKGYDAYAVIWTTTPWTLPANLAIAFHPDFNYVALLAKDKVYVVSEELRELFEKDTKISGKIIGTLKGKELEHLHFSHPFYDRKSLGILASYVTNEQGTGCVHTAPGHGLEDFISGLKYGLEILCPVDGKGNFEKELPLFGGMNVFEANPKVIELLKTKKALLSASTVHHSYPHCWRCKNPLIFRATKQWFISLEHNDLRKESLNAIENVEWIPSWGRNRIYSMVENRPDWCISRQRRWGVAINILSCANCGTFVNDKTFFENVVNEIEKRGAGVWMEGDAARFLPEGYSCSKCGGKDFVKEEDILDVWFDSGVSHKAILGKTENLPWPSEVYLEGSDQHRGWFHTSLLTSIILEGKAPYKTVITHGFTLDAQGRKMAKSEGNVIAPSEIIKKYGAEILRLWVSMVDYRDDVRLSYDLLNQNAESYMKIRNTIRYLLGNLYDFDPEKDSVKYENMVEIDRFILNLFNRLIPKVKKAYEDYSFHIIHRELLHFCTVTLSAFYLDILKDRLYCCGKKSIERLSAQTTLHIILVGMLKLLAPILPFTAEEAWKCLYGEEKETIHIETFPEKFIEEDTKLIAKWEKLWSIRDVVNKSLEESRQKGEIGKSLEAKVIIQEDGENYDLLCENLKILPEIFIVSQVELLKGEQLVKVIPLKTDKCMRCWNIPVETIDFEEEKLCPRCFEVVSKL